MTVAISRHNECYRMLAALSWRTWIRYARIAVAAMRSGTFRSTARTGQRWRTFEMLTFLLKREFHFGQISPAAEEVAWPCT
jgi:hypothetical protein